VKQDKIEENKIENEPKTENASVPEIIKKSSPVPIKSKKQKNKNGKKKKPHLMAKQDGFEIIEPEFNNAPSNEADVDELEISDGEMAGESEAPSATSESEIVENVVLSSVEEESNEPVVIVEQEVFAKISEEILQSPETIEEEKTPEVSDLREIIKNVDNEDDAVIDISDADICRKADDDICFEMSPVQEVEQKVETKSEVQNEAEVVDKPEVQLKIKVNLKPETQVSVQTINEVEAKAEVQVKSEPEPMLCPFQDTDFFNDHVNIAALERDLMENLRLLDDDFDLKSPIINPLYDFPITSAVRKWLNAKQCESFDSLFHMQNLKKLRELHDDDDDEDDDETESNISEKETKSETDSDYASDSHAKANGDSPTCSTHAKGTSEKSSKCNKLIAKESFCALM